MYQLKIVKVNLVDQYF